MRYLLLVLLTISITTYIAILPKITKTTIIRPWCDRDIVKYYIWADLNRTAYEEGWHEFLNSRIIQSAAKSRNAVRTIWPPYQQVAWGSYDVMSINAMGGVKHG